MANIQEFISNLKRDNLLSPARFRVSILGKDNDVPTAPQEIMFNCAAATIPGLTLIATSDKRHGIGHQQTFPDGRELTPVTLSFYESNSNKERKYFTDWVNKIYDPTTKRFNYFDNISKTIKIDQLDKQDKIIYTCYLFDAWPTHVSDLNRAYAAIDSFELMSVSFNYNDMYEQFYDSSGTPITIEIL